MVFKKKEGGLQAGYASQWRSHADGAVLALSGLMGTMLMVGKVLVAVLIVGP